MASSDKINERDHGLSLFGGGGGGPCRLHSQETVSKHMMYIDKS